MTTYDFFERYQERIALGAPSGCWLWSAGIGGSNGYGVVWARGKSRLVHREAYESVGGYGSADGLVVRHRCDTPACCNPAHLELGTYADNSRDMVERGRHVAVRGEAKRNAKLTESDVRAIRAEYANPERTLSQKAIALRFGVDQSAISLIVTRKEWKHVADLPETAAKEGARHG